MKAIIVLFLFAASSVFAAQTIVKFDCETLEKKKNEKFSFMLKNFDKPKKVDFYTTCTEEDFPECYAVEHEEGSDLDDFYLNEDCSWVYFSSKEKGQNLHLKADNIAIDQIEIKLYKKKKYKKGWIRVSHNSAPETSWFSRVKCKIKKLSLK